MRLFNRAGNVYGRPLQKRAEPGQGQEELATRGASESLCPPSGLAASRGPPTETPNPFRLIQGGGWQSEGPKAPARHLTLCTEEGKREPRALRYVSTKMERAVLLGHRNRVAEASVKMSRPPHTGPPSPARLPGGLGRREVSGLPALDPHDPAHPSQSPPCPSPPHVDN